MYIITEVTNENNTYLEKRKIWRYKIINATCIKLWLAIITPQ